MTKLQNWFPTLSSVLDLVPQFFNSRIWSPYFVKSCLGHNWTLTVSKWYWLPRVTFLLDDDCHVSYSDWMLIPCKMKCIVIFIDQLEYDTWQWSSNKIMTRGRQHSFVKVNVQLWHGDQHCTILQNRMTKFVR